MTKEDKELVIIDISARFPYGVVLDIDTSDWKAPQGHIKVKIEGFGILFKDMSLIINGCYYGDNFKPYLRPMSSMTEEEENEWCGLNIDPLLEAVNERHTRIEDLMLRAKSQYKPLDWLNKHHFDYRGLIEKGLALEAPKGMYK